MIAMMFALERWIHLAQTTTTVAETVSKNRNDATLTVVLVGVFALAAFALLAPRWARALNARKEARTD